MTIDTNDLDRARRTVLAVLRRADRAGVEGLPLVDLFGVLSTWRYFRRFQVWGFRRVLKVVRACREVEQGTADVVICALEVLAHEDRVLLAETDGETLIFLTEKGKNKSEDWT